ncbi:MAG: LacI family transcriptional regulator [Spirochaetia bacterium]|jgi:DNA-binding LacI/PurR family transcriptional regulator|nr:LacI family transcriptional regulator [Spirochaetia bacterium]
MSQVTRDSVAKKAGVSSATVSRVFNAPLSVSPVLRNKVLESAKALGYIPNKAAAQLRRSGTGVIAVVELAKKGRPYYWGSLASFDWFYGQVMRGLQTAVEKSSWQLTFASIRNEEELLQLAARCDGIIGYDVDDKEEEKLFMDAGIPCILCHHIMPGPGLCRFSTDNERGGVLQADYLGSLGKSRPLYVTGYLSQVQPHVQRMKGFCSHAWEHCAVEEVAFGCRGEVEKLANRVQGMFEDGLIDSIACVNDLTLVQLLLHLKEYDLACVGYDAAPFSDFLPGTIASVDLHIGTIYQSALASLIAHLGGADLEGRTFEPSLVIKGEGKP